MNSLSLILPNKAHMTWISEMTRNGLDYKNYITSHDLAEICEEFKKNAEDSEKDVLEDQEFIC